MVSAVRSVSSLRKHASRFEQHSSMSMQATTAQSQSAKKANEPDQVDLLSVLNEWIGKNQFGRAILLRALPTRSELSAHDQDVDLLVTSEQAAELLRLAFEDVLSGRCHVQIESRHRSKIQLVLWAPGTSDSLKVDLWLEWNQMLSRRRIIVASSFQSLVQSETPCQCDGAFVTDQDASLSRAARLCCDVELAMLVLHLLRKKRGVVSSINLRRLLQLVRVLKSDLRPESDAGKLVASVCMDLGNAPEKLSASPAAGRSVEPSKISCATGLVAQAFLESRLQRENVAGPTLRQRCAGLLKNGFYSAMRMAGRAARRVFSSRTCPTLAFVGSDGCGKTSLSALVSAAHSGKWTTVVGRKLYRRSLIYAVFSSVTRSVCRISRSDFDDRLATVLAFRAMLACWIMLVWMRIRNALSCTPRGLVLDRTPESMLIVGRRGVQPVTAPGSRILEYLAPPLRQVLLVVPYHVLARRKQELSWTVHEQYQRLLFEQVIRQPVVSTVLLSNAASPLAALEALEQILELTPNVSELADLSGVKTRNGSPVFISLASHQKSPETFLPPVIREHREEWAA